jgi:peptide/nickel transport system permease protein
MAVKQNRTPSSFVEGPMLEGEKAIRPEAAKRRTIPVLSRLNSITALRSWKIRLGLSILGFFVLLAIFAPLIAWQNPQTFSNDSLASPSAAHWLGTTQVGQDVFAQLIYGTRVTLLVGFSVGVIATFMAVVIGLAAGYFGGVIDDVLSMFMNIFLLIPAVPLAIVLGGYLTVRGPIPVTVVLVITGWAFGARVLRAQTLSMRRRDFVEAARASGESTARIIFSEILPNELGIIFSGFIFTILYAILAEIGLEFLGLSDITVISWGNILFWAGNQSALLVGAWWWFVPPGVCIALVGASLALINFGMDEVINPRLRDASRS